MLVTIGITAVILILLWWILRHQTGQNFLAGMAAWIFNTSTATATIILVYFGFVVGILAIIGLILLIGLWTNAQAFIYIGLIIFGALLALITFLIERPISAMATALADLRKGVGNVIKGFKLKSDAKIDEIITSLPEGEIKADLIADTEKAQKWLDWVSRWFDPAILRNTAGTINNLTLGNAERLLKSALRGIAGTKVLLLWVGILAFTAMFIPDGDIGKWLVPLFFGLGLLLLIALHKGPEWREKYKLPDLYWITYKLIRWGVRISIAAVIILAILPWGQDHFPHWILAVSNYLHIQEEQSAKDEYGQDFDQRIWRTTAACDGYVDQSHWLWGSRRIRVDVPFNLFLWDTGAKEQTFLDGRNYKLYMVESGRRRMTPDPDRKVWTPVSKVIWAGDVAIRKVTLPKETMYYPDNRGQPWSQIYRLPYDSVAEVTQLTAFADGNEVRFARVYDRDRTYEIWIVL